MIVWKNVLEALEKGNLTIIMQTAYRPSRSESIAFAQPYPFRFAYILVVNHF